MKWKYFTLFTIIFLTTSYVSAIKIDNEQVSQTPQSSKEGTENIDALVVLIAFADRDPYFSHDDVDDFFNQVGYNGYGNNGSIHDYWYAVSQGRVSVNTHVQGYYRAPKPFDYYDIEDGGHTHELIDSALTWLDNQGFDFSTLTVDNNRIKALSFQFVGNSGQKGLWGHSSAHVRHLDGVQTYAYQISELGQTEMHLGGICHEQGHMLFGWPDTYDIDGSNGGSSGCGKFDLMAGGNSDNTGAPSRNPMPPNPYFRYLCGWNDMIPLNDYPNDTTIEVVANSWNTYVYRNPDRAGEMFILEARRKPYRNVDMPGEGVLIWHIDSVIPNNANQHHTEHQHYKVSLVQADNKYDLENGSNVGDGNDYFKEGSYSTVNLNHTKWWNTAYSGFALREISAVDSIMTMQYGTSNASDVAIMSEKTSGGSISPLGLRYYTYNTNRRFAATALDGFEVFNCTVDGDSLGAVSSYEFENITAPHNIKFSFAHKSTKLKDVSVGVNYNYYEGSWRSMPDFNTLTPVKTGELRMLSVSIPGGASDNYGIRYSGYFEAPQDGEYTFYMTADDGCVLTIEDIEIVSNQCQSETTGKMVLKKGYHPVVIDFFEAQIGQTMSLFWSGPGSDKTQLRSLYTGTVDTENTALESVKYDMYIGTDKHNFIIKCDQLSSFDMEVYSITGALVARNSKCNAINGHATFSNSAYDNGVYIIKVTDNQSGSSFLKKVVLAH